MLMAELLPARRRQLPAGIIECAAFLPPFGPVATQSVMFLMCGAGTRRIINRTTSDLDRSTEDTP